MKKMIFWRIGLILRENGTILAIKTSAFCTSEKMNAFVLAWWLFEYDFYLLRKF